MCTQRDGNDQIQVMTRDSVSGTGLVSHLIQQSRR